MAHLVRLAWMISAHITEGAVYINVSVCVPFLFNCGQNNRQHPHFLQAKL